MKLRNKRILKKIKNRKGDINWELVDAIMQECGFEPNMIRFSYDRKMEEE